MKRLALILAVVAVVVVAAAYLGRAIHSTLETWLTQLTAITTKP